MSGLYVVARDGVRTDLKRKRKISSNRRDAAEMVAEAGRLAKMAADAGDAGFTILERLYQAIREKDTVASQALVREACIEIRASVQMTRNLSDYLAPPKSVVETSKERRA